MILKSRAKPATYTIRRKPNKNPAVGPIKASVDAPYANTGRPTAPSSKYVNTVAKPSLEPKLRPMIKTAKVCRVTGTGSKGTIT